ncbi:phosphate butyryltransferase [Texcoconibacillus texcoconensis]|uniref:Phosphate butyryltransferase n=2 Tax=Texcoconibacillus texcoconensis TaxID=1095777 RepID=A0A840QNV2_9BACI|nr:bifunctional enoyl-CoA hydratase/phosphate acetyltransferase [Texcoconibacillus texcoconensis]MBB5173049.1 phosphate butyryltransferase [Texcoconibacillus texcoconensis]
MNTLYELLERAQNRDHKATIAIAHGTDRDVLQAALTAVSKGIASVRITGPKQEILQQLNELGGKADGEMIKIEPTTDEGESVKRAVELVRNEEADVVMKGMVSTSHLLKVVLNKENGIRSSSVLSHVALFQHPIEHRLMFVTDAAMNISPGIDEKVAIVGNAVQIAHKVGMDCPKVAALAAVETVNPSMQATVDAAVLAQMNARNQISGCVVDGPLALDNAINIQAAEHKGIQSSVAGSADILFVPTIEVGNVLYKSLVYFSRANVASVIAGSKAPIVLTSRADSAENKLFSIALAICSA